jgi:hypothetical protein
MTPANVDRFDSKSLNCIMEKVHDANKQQLSRVPGLSFQGAGWASEK